MNSTLAEDDRLSKSEFADSLRRPARYAFLDRCAAIETRLTNACAACVTEWARLFSNS